MMEWRLSNLLGEYQQKTGERLTYRAIAEATGISKTTVTAMATGSSKRTDLETLDAVLTFLRAKLDRPLTTDDLLHFHE